MTRYLHVLLTLCVAASSTVNAMPGTVNAIPGHGGFNAMPGYGGFLNSNQSLTLDEVVHEMTCEEPILCLPLEEAARLYPTAPHVLKYKAKNNTKELFIFVDYLADHSSQLDQYDWSKITKVVLINASDSETIVPKAHSEGAQVLYFGVANTSLLPDPEYRKNLTAASLSAINATHTDGVYIYPYGIINSDSKEQAGLTAFMEELSSAAHQEPSDPLVTVCVTFKKGAALQDIDAAAIAPNVDFLVFNEFKGLNDFDESDHAMATSPVDMIAPGLETYKLDDLSKVVLVFAWVGTEFLCTGFIDNFCSFNFVRQDPLFEIDPYEKQDPVLIGYNFTIQSPFMDVYSNNGDHVESHFEQIWYENPASIRAKVDEARRLGVAGTGVMAANYLQYSDERMLKNMEMWNALAME